MIKEIRKTSIEAFKIIQENGLLSRRRFEVYEWLFENGPASARDCYVALTKGRSINPSSYLSRLSELRNLGVVYELEEKKLDPLTGMSVIQWDVTEKLPIKVDKPVHIKCKTCKGTGYLTEQQLRLI